jgi:hypothetical protein
MAVGSSCVASDVVDSADCEEGGLFTAGGGCSVGGEGEEYRDESEVKEALDLRAVDLCERCDGLVGALSA